MDSTFWRISSMLAIVSSAACEPRWAALVASRPPGRSERASHLLCRRLDLFYRAGDLAYRAGLLLVELAIWLDDARISAVEELMLAEPCCMPIVISRSSFTIVEMPSPSTIVPAKAVRSLLPSGLP